MNDQQNEEYSEYQELSDAKNRTSFDVAVLNTEKVHAYFKQCDQRISETILDPTLGDEINGMPGQRGDDDDEVK